MNRAEYLGAVGRSIDFLDERERDEVLADMAELYDGLAARGMDDEDVQQRIGVPSAVAAEYRLVEELDRLDRSPGTAAGLRIGFATLTGRLARGAAFQVLGILWFSLAIVALLLVNRLAMRGLSRFMRRRVLRRRGSIAPGFAGPEGGPARGEDEARVQVPAEGARGRWINSGRAAWQMALLALVLAVVSAGLMLAVDSPQFPLAIDRTEPLELDDAARLEIHASAVEVRLEVGTPATARITADLKRTFAQLVDLQVSVDGSTVVVDARYVEGLDWGINPRPLLVVTVPVGGTPQIAVQLEHGAEADLAGIPANICGFVTMEEQRRP